MGKIVGIDYGKKRIGIAFANETNKIALPYKTVDASFDMQKTIDSILMSLNQIYNEITLFVIGLPLLLSGQEGDMAKEVKKFGEKLKDKTQINVKYFDERLTSAGIEKEMKYANISRKKRSKKIDTLAATRILQGFLDLP